MYLTLKAIFAFHAIHRFAFLCRTLDFTHNLKKNLDFHTLKSIFYVYLSSFFVCFLQSLHIIFACRGILNLNAFYYILVDSISSFSRLNSAKQPLSSAFLISSIR